MRYLRYNIASILGAIVFFAVAMRQEEPALLVDQQLVQPGLDLFGGQPKLPGGKLNRTGDRRVPCLAKAKLLRIEPNSFRGCSRENDLKA